MGIEKQKTTFYTPHCNGGVERWHSTKNSLLAKTVEAHQRDWPQRLPYVVAAYNATVHESTGFSFFFGLPHPVLEVGERVAAAGYLPLLGRLCCGVTRCGPTGRLRSDLTPVSTWYWSVGL